MDYSHYLHYSNILFTYAKCTILTICTICIIESPPLGNLETGETSWRMLGAPPRATWRRSPLRN